MGFGNWMDGVYSAETAGTSAPVHDFGFIDFEAMIITGFEAWRGTDSAIDVEDQATASTHQVMVIVADSILEPSGRASGLDSPDETLVGEGTEGVIDRLPRDRTDLVAHDFSELLGRGMRPIGDSLHDRQALRRDLKT